MGASQPFELATFLCTDRSPVHDGLITFIGALNDKEPISAETIKTRALGAGELNTDGS